MNLGKYEILGELGRGSFGTVYRARDTMLDIEVALKVLKPVWMNEQGAVEMFYREARAAARLEHPNIVAIREMGEIEGRLYIAMRLIDGESLGARIKRGPMTLDEALPIVEQIASALSYAHARGLVHRDVKPNNILIGSDGTASLTDFGLVRGAEQASLASSASVGGVVGTSEYVAPEVWKGEPTSQSSDAYALGCVVYEMLTGLALFTGSSGPQVMFRHFAPRDLSLITDDHVRTVISKAVVEDSTMRSRVDEVARQLCHKYILEAPAAALEDVSRVTRLALSTSNWVDAVAASDRWLALAPDDVEALEARAIASAELGTQREINAVSREARMAALAGDWLSLRAAASRWIQLSPDDRGAHEALVQAESNLAPKLRVAPLDTVSEDANRTSSPLSEGTGMARAPDVGLIPGHDDVANSVRADLIAAKPSGGRPSGPSVDEQPALTKVLSASVRNVVKGSKRPRAISFVLTGAALVSFMVLTIFIAGGNPPAPGSASGSGKTGFPDGASQGSAPLASAIVASVPAPTGVLADSVVTASKSSTSIPTVSERGSANVADQRWLDVAVNTSPPKLDVPSLAIRFKGVDPALATRMCVTEVKRLEVGATRVFSLKNQNDERPFTVTASLKYATQNLYMWVQSGNNQITVDDVKLRRAADTFEQKVLPTIRTLFDTDFGLGVDCDSHVYVLHAAGIGNNVGAYVSEKDSFARAVRNDSNEADMIVLNAAPGYDGSNPSSDTYVSTLVSQFLTLVNARATHGSSAWINEGAALFAQRLAGYKEIDAMYSFAAAPGTPLDSGLEHSYGEAAIKRGAGYLFWSFLYDRVGEQVFRKLTQSKERSPQAVMRVLAENGIVNADTGNPYTFPEFFADFTAANYLGKRRTDGGTRFSYGTIETPPMTQLTTTNTPNYPYDRSGRIGQFGTDYVEVLNDSPLKISFQGSTSVSLISMANADGEFWYSNRADQSNPRLTLALDLSKVSRATLKFRTWYQLEKDWDYGFVSASIDGGTTWKILKTTSCINSNPYGNSVGCGYTGSSGGDRVPRWIEESADLAPFTGKQILVRWEVLTDLVVNQSGLAIDNIEVPELGYKDDVSRAGSWQAEGFIRVSTPVPQSWAVQLIEFNHDGSINVRRFPLLANAGLLMLDLGKSGKVKRGVVAISPTTLVTTEPGTYRLTITAP